jgi:hypothetical protein
MLQCYKTNVTMLQCYNVTNVTIQIWAQETKNSDKMLIINNNIDKLGPRRGV